MVTKGYGFSLDDIDWSCPADLEPYAQAHELEQKEQDTQNWYNGMYVMSAIESTIGNSGWFKKKGTKANKYVKEPILQKATQSKEMTEKEKQLKREAFVMSLMAMQTNFELNHPKKKGDKE